MPTVTCCAELEPEDDHDDTSRRRFMQSAAAAMKLRDYLDIGDKDADDRSSRWRGYAETHERRPIRGEHPYAADGTNGLDRRAPADGPSRRATTGMPEGERGGQGGQAPRQEIVRDDGSSGDRTDAKASDGSEDAGSERRRKRRPLVLGVAGLIVLLMAGGGVFYWLSTRGKATTDDAYTDGDIVSVAPQVSGQVVSLDVADNQFVHKGDPLFRIDSRQYLFNQEQAQGQLDTTKARISSQKLGVEIAKKNFPAALDLARANLDAAKANLQLQQANYDRQRSLPKLATTQQDVDTNASNFQQAKAQVEQAQARLIQAEPVQQNIGQSEEQVSQLQGQIEQARGRLDQSKLNVEWSVVRAPQDGWVTRRNVNGGDYVASGQQVMSLVTTDVWVTANFKETELDGMRPGQQVTIAVDAYPNLDLHGHVDSIQRGSGSKFSAFPAENATGNFIKIVQRVPVKIVIDSGLKKDEPLPLGISVEPTVLLK